jgi:hypothetical protein
MNMQILRAGQAGIAGYETVMVDTNSLSLGVASDNQCRTILAPDILDSFNLELIEQLIGQLTQKLRIGGELVVGGTDIRLFTKAVLNGMLDIRAASKIVSATQSMMPADMVAALLSARGLAVKSIHMDGIHFEIKTQRTQ